MLTSEPVDVFISYASADRKKVLELLKQFRLCGIRFWRDQEQLTGASIYGAGIVRAIQQSKVFVLICSRASLSSPNVRNEIITNWERGSRCYLPIWIEPPSLIPDEVCYWLAGCQWIETDSLAPELWMSKVLSALKSLGITPETTSTSQTDDRPSSSVDSVSSESKDVKTPDRDPSEKPAAAPLSGNLSQMDSTEAASREQQFWKKRLGISETQNLHLLGLQFCLIPPGKCSIGATFGDAMADADERPPIPVIVPNPLIIMKTPLTCGQIRTRLPALSSASRWSQWERTHSGLSDFCPAGDLGLIHIREFCEAYFRETGIRLRLPTEAEWEYCARAGSTSRYWWGNDFIPQHSIHSVLQQAEVGDTRENTWGLVDVLGNMAEWTASAYGPLQSQFPLCEAAVSGIQSRFRVVRGGSYREQRAADLRLSRRQRVAADSTARFIGARLVVEADASTIQKITGSGKGVQ